MNGQEKTYMTDKVFLDTNILVYLYDKNEAKKGTVAKQLIQEYGITGNIVLSTQVLQEFYVTVTRMGKHMLTKEEASEIVNDFSEFPLIQVNKDIIVRAMKRHQTKVFSFWDSLIVEAALQAGCSTLLTEDMQDGFIIDAMQIRNPFKIENDG
ncbi:MAG TPA: PIN domain nuclease [Gammaproteobacteria bacterium]|nr:PIN domain nuclease [Gammaproteobacteria bacterium]